MDLSNLTTVRKSSVQTQNFDVRYKHSNGKFQLSDRFYSSKGMNTNGFTFHTTPDGKTALLSIRPNEDSVFYKGKAGDADKDTSFAYSVLEAALKDLGMIGDTENKFENFKLEKVGTQDGVDYYQITEWTEEDNVPEASEEAQTDLTGQPMSAEEEDEPEDNKETVAVDAEEEKGDDYDPFA